MLRHLNTIVVSLDRIGSWTAEEPHEEQWRTLCEFLDDWDVARKLAEARRILSEPFSEAVGPEGIDELEREMDNAPHWSGHARKPPSDQ